MMAESWWRNAVFYRIDVRSFQDSNADGLGDLRGIADRMDYLQSLGVDGIVLDNLGDPRQTDSPFAAVVRAALPRHIRVLVTLHDSPDDSDDHVAAEARLWLTRGAAGLYLRSTRSADEAAPLVHLLRKLTDSFPGSRIVLAETATNPAPSTVHTIDLDDPSTSRVSRGTLSSLADAQLTQVPLELANATARTIRAALNGVNAAPSGSPLFLSEEMFSDKDILAPANRAALDGRRRAFALVLLASRGAAAMRYGQEIGMLPLEGTDSNPPLMQWTPTNITVAPAAAPVVAATPAPTPVPTRSDVYGAFKPYVAGPRPIVLPKPPDEADATTPSAAPAASAEATPIIAVPPPVDPATLPGFTSGKLPQPAPTDAATLNVASEDTDPNSLLNLYRRLIQLRHDDLTLRTGQEILLDYDALGAVVWIRQPAFGSRSTAIVAVCNLSAVPLHLSLDEELKQHHVVTGTLRDLLSGTALASSVQSTGDLTLPPFGVFLGELYH